MGRGLQRRAIILLYHRITEPGSDPWALDVAPGHFAEHLEVLRRYCRPMALQELGHALGSRRIPHGAVAVTFDDGYADNLHDAVPVLEQHGVPATVFVASGAVGDPRGFWWDELEQILLGSGQLPAAIRLTVGGRDHCWERLEEGAGHDPSPGEPAGWRAWQPPRTARQALYRGVWNLLRDVTPEQRCHALDALRTSMGGASGLGLRHRPLSAAELGALADRPLIAIGAHTVHHTCLAARPLAFQWAEIQRSKACLEELTGRPVAPFAYPHGGRRSYTAATVAMVRAAGFARACSTTSGPVIGSSDAYQLPRVSIPDCDGDRFAKALSRWLPLRT